MLLNNSSNGFQSLSKNIHLIRRSSRLFDTWKTCLEICQDTIIYRSRIFCRFAVVLVLNRDFLATSIYSFINIGHGTDLWDGLCIIK